MATTIERLLRAVQNHPEGASAYRLGKEAGVGTGSAQLLLYDEYQAKHIGMRGAGGRSHVVYFPLAGPPQPQEPRE